MAAQRGPRQGGDVLPVDLDHAAIQLIKPHEQVDEGGFAAPGGADDGHHVARAHLQVHVPHEQAIRRIAEADAAKGHPALGQGGGEPGGIRPLLLLVQQGEHPLGPGDGGLQGGDDIGGLGHRLGNLIDVLQKGLHTA